MAPLKILALVSLCMSASVLLIQCKSRSASTNKDIATGVDENGAKGKIYNFSLRELGGKKYYVRGSCPPAMTPTRAVCNLEESFVAEDVFTASYVTLFDTPDTCRRSVIKMFDGLLKKLDEKKSAAITDSARAEVQLERDKLIEIQRRTLAEVSANAQIRQLLSDYLTTTEMHMILVNTEVSFRGVDVTKADLILAEGETIDPRAMNFVQNLHKIFLAKGGSSPVPPTTPKPNP